MKSTNEISDELFSAILIEQKKIDKIVPADPDKKNIMAEKMKEFSKIRGREFPLNYLSNGKGHGPFTELVDGSVKYDLVNGIGVNILGHSHPIVIKSNLEACTRDSLMVGNLQVYEDALTLSKKLISTVPKTRLKHFWFGTSGTQANDNALKILWQKTAPKYNVIAFKNSFAGRSIGMQDITYNADYRVGMPKLINVFYAPHFDQQNPTTSKKNTIEALDKIWNENPDSFSCMILEMIQGEGGFIFGDKDFYLEIAKWAKQKKIFLMIDEIQTFTRTTELFAFQAFGLDEYVDIVTVGKALQCCGTFYTEELNPKPSLIAGTFAGALASFIAGNKILDFLLSGNFYGKNGRMEQLNSSFMQRFKKISETTCKGKIPYYGGIGTMIAFEVGDASKDLTNKLMKLLFENGVIVWTAGHTRHRIRLLLPTTLTEEHIDEIFKIFEKSILQLI
ncbi:MAG: aminotransferase class III-fold pyridoxal phosphate-dependent enzyme [Bacteriovoracaceae bacterium]